MIVFGEGAFGRYLGPEGGPHDGFSVLIRGRERALCPCEGTVRSQLSTSQEVHEGVLPENPTMEAPRSPTCGLQNCEKQIFALVPSPWYLLQQPKKTSLQATSQQGSLEP